MSVNAVPIPISEPMTKKRDRKRYPDPQQEDPREGTITRLWVEYLTSQAQIQAQAARRLFSTAVADQSGSIAATDISNGALAAGLYRVSYYATIVQGATVSSSLTVTLDWTDRTVAKATSGAAITANTTATIQSGTFLVRIDKNSPVRFSTAYVSVGATALNYDLALVLELVE